MVSRSRFLVKILNTLFNLFQLRWQRYSRWYNDLLILWECFTQIGLDSSCGELDIFLRGCQSVAQIISVNYDGEGNPIDALKTCISGLSYNMWKTYIINCNGSTHITAIGEKHNNSYCSFLVFGYAQSAIHLKMIEGTWSQASLE